MYIRFSPSHTNALSQLEGCTYISSLAAPCCMTTTIQGEKHRSSAPCCWCLLPYRTFPGCHHYIASVTGASPKRHNGQYETLVLQTREHITRPVWGYLRTERVSNTMSSIDTLQYFKCQATTKWYPLYSNDIWYSYFCSYIFAPQLSNHYLYNICPVTKDSAGR